MVPIIIMLKMLKYHPMIIFGNVHLKIFVEVIKSNTKSIDRLILFIDTSSLSNYYNRFLGVQYSIDMEIIKYATNLDQNLTSNVGIFRITFFPYKTCFYFRYIWIILVVQNIISIKCMQFMDFLFQYFSRWFLLLLSSLTLVMLFKNVKTKLR